MEITLIQGTSGDIGKVSRACREPIKRLLATGERMVANNWTCSPFILINVFEAYGFEKVPSITDAIIVKYGEAILMATLDKEVKQLVVTRVVDALGTYENHNVTL